MLLDRDDGTVRLLQHDLFPFPWIARAFPTKQGSLCHGRSEGILRGILGPFKWANMTAAARSAGCERADNNRSSAMHVFDLHKEQEWNPKRHVEKILGE